MLGERTMKRGSPGLLAAVAVVMLLGSACSRGESSGGESTSRAAVETGSLAPNFTLPSAQGGVVSLDGFRGKKAVLLYFSMGPG